MTEFLTNSFRLTALFLLIVFGVVFYSSEKYSFKKNILLLFLTTLAAYLLAYWEPVQKVNALFQITFFLSVSFPFSFWLFSKALFDDEFVWSRKFWILTLVAPLVLNILYRLNDEGSLDFYRHFKVIPYLISVVFIILAIYESMKNKENDLVLSRLKKRNVFVIFSSFLALFSVYFFFVKEPMKLPVEFELIQNMIISIFILLFFHSQFEYKKLFVENSSSKTTNNLGANEDIQKRIIDKLQMVFENEKIYTNEGITITWLSEKLNEKEYLVRRAINGELGYTNFNSFLNHYRIVESCKLISESQFRELTFQEIAFQMGYQSVATFNRAFKNEIGITPSEFYRLNKKPVANKL